MKKCSVCRKSCPRVWDMFLGKCRECYLKKDLPKINPKTVFFYTSVELRPISMYCEGYQKWLLSIKGAKPTDVDLKRRTWGWTHDFRTAHEIVTNNWGDIHECSYPWVVIEEIKSGNSAACDPIAKYFYQWKQTGSDEDFDGTFFQIDGWPKQLEDYYDEHHFIRKFVEMG